MSAQPDCDLQSPISNVYLYHSQTVMLACISSIESDLGETLNTLKWANRGRNIRNLAIVNHEYSSEVRALKEQVAKLKGEVEKSEWSRV